MWPDDSPFLHFIYGLRPCSSTEYNYSVRAKPCCTFTRRPHFQNLPCQNFEKITFSFSQNAQSLRLWKSTLTQNRIHSTIFEILIISFSKWTYATSTYLFSYRSRMLPVSISLSMGDLTCFVKAFSPVRHWQFYHFINMPLRISSCFPPATHVRAVQQGLHRRLRFKTVGITRSLASANLT